MHQSEKAILSRQSSSVALSDCTITPYAPLKTDRCSITKRIQSSEVEINATCGPPKLKMRPSVAASVVAPTLTGEARRLCPGHRRNRQRPSAARGDAHPEPPQGR